LRKCLTLIIDPRPESFGHYFELSKNICTAFIKLNQEFIFLSCYADKLQIDFINNVESIFTHNKFIKIDFENSVFLKSILNLFDLKDVFFHVVLLNDHKNSITIVKNILSIRNQNIDFHVIALCGPMLRGWPLGIILRNLDSFIYFSNLEQCKTIFTIDPIILKLDTSHKLRYLPDFQMGIERKFIPNNVKLTLGYYGNLNPQRGIKLFLSLAIFNPRVNFRVTGYGDSGNTSAEFKFKNTFSSIIKKIVLKFLNFIPNIEITKGYFRNHSDLVTSLSKNDAIFYAANLSPYSSGIANLSLSMGVPVIWIPGDSAASDTLERFFPEGKIMTSEIYKFGFITQKIRAVRNSQPKSRFEWHDFTSPLKCSCED
jgi:hypothetical protein